MNYGLHQEERILFHIVGFRVLPLGPRGKPGLTPTRCPVTTELQVRSRATVYQKELVLICGVMIVNPKIPLALQCQAHVPMLGQGIVHLMSRRLRCCADMSV